MQSSLQVLVNESQSALIQGRVIFDNILLSHELIKGYGRKNISPRCMLKIDLQKAYDSVEWPFLKYLMLELGFPFQFVTWVMACLTIVSYSFNVNSEMTISIEGKKGLRQGDPISPCLFVLCMEYLHRCLLSLRNNPSFKFHPRCKKLGLVHVCFVDDLLLFTRGDLASVRLLFDVFHLFFSASGLKSNQGKNSIYFGGVSLDIQQQILQDFGLVKGELSFKYLGVPLSARKLTVLQCQPLIKKITARIDSWTSKFISYAGRVQLIRPVLFSMQMYWCQVFLLPQKVIKLIQSVCKTFLWTGSSGDSKRSLVAWETLILPKLDGGMNLTCLKTQNKVSSDKLLWNLAQKKDKVWIRWVHTYYIKNHDINQIESPKQASWVIKKILDARKYISTPSYMPYSYSTRKTYIEMRGTVTQVPWKKFVCNNPTPPKCFVGSQGQACNM